ncbi:MAG: 3-deoxy-D-manno-octulosonic acid transferase [Bacteroidales bacterium]|nr:3-deoxy-D-manno-octulosonic acid transferase [Bacteroidales bacterium]
MFRIIYSIAIRFFGFCICIASLFNEKAKQWMTGRKDQWEKININLAKQENAVWFHCSSLGEFEQGRPVIEEYKKHNPKAFIVLTFFSPSGYEIRKNYENADLILYLPLDIKKNVNKFLDLIKPKIVVFVKNEFWYNYLHQLWLRNIPLFLISANFREDNWFFKSYGRSFRKMLGFFSYIFVQNEQSLKILNRYNIENVTIAGDTRVDRVYQISKEVKENSVIEKFKNQKILIVAGSSWKQDEELLIKYINESGNNLKWIIAPHEIKKENILRIQKSITRPSVKYSTYKEKQDSNAEVLVIDNIGMLSSLYKYGDIAYIGGGFGKGIHNILEPATFGIPVIFGPNYKKFREACELRKQGGAMPVNDFSDLEKIFNELIYNDEVRQKAGNISKKYIKDNLGSAQLIVDKLLTN